MMNEADTRAKLIDPALHARGWNEDLIKREESAGKIELVGGQGRRLRSGKTDYTLRVRVGAGMQPVAVAIIEAKKESLTPGHGLEQAKLYAETKRLNVPFVFSTNGHLFVEFDAKTGITSKEKPLTAFPSPDELRARYEEAVGFNLESEAAKPLIQPYTGGEAGRRYYQDAAIRAVFEKLARNEKRALLALATGAGKTFIAVNILKKIADAGQLTRALFVCDRDELRSQAGAAFRKLFGDNAREVSSREPQKNARVLIATYQTLDVSSDDADANFLKANYPNNYFSHIIIDECHRSAWGKWSEVFRRNADAVQVGLTATPRKIKLTEASKEIDADEQITADNIKHFGEPVYEYTLAQGIEDGYLAACEIIRRDILINAKPQPEGETLKSERETGVVEDDLRKARLVDAITGQPLSVMDVKERYEAPGFERNLVLPDRTGAICRDLFTFLLETGNTEQKTIIFCASDKHADDVAREMNNLYAEHCASVGKERVSHYAFKCTAANQGNDYLADFRGSNRSYFVATTVDLLTTGVDVPNVRNIVFFKYVRSPIAFYQMVGRGTRIDAASGKLLFRVYDFTNATRLFGEEFITRQPVLSEPTQPDDDDDAGGEDEPRRLVQAEGIAFQTVGTERLVITRDDDGKEILATVEEYKRRLAERLIAEDKTIEGFRARWIKPEERRALINGLIDAGLSPTTVKLIGDMVDYDLYDVLAELAYGLRPRTQRERAEAFRYKHEEWLESLPKPTTSTIKAIADQFAIGGTDALESNQIFQVPTVQQAGGLNALRAVEGRTPRELLDETKARMFAA
jgi:type I restriction enzyme R subunit